MSSSFKTLLARRLCSVLKPHSSLHTLLADPLNRSYTHPASSIPTILPRSVSTSSQIVDQSEPESSDVENGEETKKKKIPLDLFFKQAVGLAEKTEGSEDESEGSENRKMKKKLRELEGEIRKLKGVPRDEVSLNGKAGKKVGVVKNENSPAKRLRALFTNNRVCDDEPEEEVAVKRDDRMVIKELSEDMVVFVKHLYNGGYFNDANFLPDRRFDVGCFENSFGRDFIKFAAEKFGKDNQDIAKWLSGSDLKKVAIFGCPSLSKKAVFSAKRLRFFFGVQEEIVCRRCALKQSCKFMNQNVWKGDAMNLVLADVMRVIILYGLESTPPQLVVSDEVKASVARLLKEVMNLSQTII